MSLGLTPEELQDIADGMVPGVVVASPFCCAYCGKGWSSLASLVGHVQLRHAAKLKDTTMEVKP